MVADGSGDLKKSWSVRYGHLLHLIPPEASRMGHNVSCTILYMKVCGHIYPLSFPVPLCENVVSSSSLRKETFLLSCLQNS